MFSRLVLAVGCCLTLVIGCTSTHPPVSQSSSDAPVVVARYADTVITLDEFERRYAHSVGSRTDATDDSLAAYRDFLDRYVDFRLKVRAARAAGMDTTAHYKQEIRSYQQQTARPRLLREEVMEPIIRTLYERQQREVDVSHLLIRVPPDAPPSDTLAAYQRLATLVDSLQHGADFGALAERHSDDPSAQQQGAPGYRGRLGYLTAGRTVKAFEDRMYETPEGERSSIFRTRFGYHVLKVHDRRPARPDIQIAHVMIRPDGPAPSDTAAARKEAEALRDSLQAGADFASLARRHSEDPQSARKGGNLGTVRSDQRLPSSFKEAAFVLDSVGTISDVVRTRFGYHIIKLTDRKTLPSYEEAYENLKKQAARLPRSDSAQKQFAHAHRARLGTRVDTARVLDVLNISSLHAPADSLTPDAVNSDVASTKVALLGDSTYTIGDIAAFSPPEDTEPAATVGGRIDAFLNDAAITHAALQLEAQDPEFRLLMKEYREGVLLFQFMQDSVWTAAAQDTAALQRYFQNHRDRYRLPKRADVRVIRSPSDSLLQPLASALDGDVSLDSIAAAANRTAPLRMDTVTVPLTPDSTQSVYRRALEVAEGAHVGPFHHNNQVLLLVRGLQHPARRQTFEEARSAVVQDYQEQYEKQVMQRLRRRYDARTYPERLHRAFTASPQSEPLTTDERP